MWVVLIDGREPFLLPRFASVDFLPTADQAHDNTPSAMPIHHGHQELRFGHIEIAMSSLFSHEAGGMFLAPRPLGLVEHNYALSRSHSCAYIVVTEVVDVLDKHTGVTRGVFLAHALSSSSGAFDLINSKSLT